MTTVEATTTSPPPPVLPSATGTLAATGSPAPETFAHTVPAEDWQRLATHAAQAGGGPDALVLAATAEVLRAWAGSPDFTLGVRPAGHAGDPLPVATPRTGGTFAQRVSDTAAALTRLPGAHAEPCALPVVVSAAGAVPGGPVPAPGTQVEVTYAVGDGGLEVGWWFAAAAVAPGLPAAIVGAFTGFLADLARGSGWSEQRIDLVPAADRALVDRVNDTAGDVPDALLHELVAAQAAARPGAPAVVDGRRRLTYGELSTYAGRIGRRLRDAGVGRGDLVAIVTEKGWEQYAAVYGVLASGAAYLPVDATSPPQRLARLLRTGRVTQVLTQSWLAGRLEWPGGVTLHQVDRDFEHGDGGPLPSVQGPQDPAYVLFTSGSTGEPKGVIVDHRGVVNLVRDVNARFAVGPDDRAFAVSALHFDASIYDVFGILAAGGTAVLPDPFERAQPDRWTERVAAEGVTVWNSVPAILELVVGQAEIRDDKPLSSIRLAVVSGDWIPLTLPDRFRAEADGAAIVGSGGPTETICWSLFYPIGEVDPGWRSIPYGKPITNQKYLIVDDELRQRPVWAVGEMAVASDVGLAHGYFGDGARTAEKFVTLPETGERAYLTGDLGRWLPDGNVEILGRVDFQVKVQGYRIELGEIEAALREQPAIEAAVVVAPENARGGRRLVAFVVATGPLDTDDVRDRLRAVLPGYMVPSSVQVLDALPLSPNGKVDRLALVGRASGRPQAPAPAPQPVSQQAPAAVAEPASPLEQLVAELVGDVLGIAGVDRGDNFFRLGGDSVSGARLARDLSEILGVPVPIRAVFDNPVAAELAAELAADPAHGPTAVEAAALYAEIRRAAV